MPLTLENQHLLHTNAYYGGEWQTAQNGTTFAVTNPASHHEIAQVTDCSTDDVEAAIEAATNAQPAWQRKTADERGKTLEKWHDLIIKNAEDLARLMTAEQGKPLSESRGEVTYAASYIHWYAAEARRVYGDILPAPQAGKRIIVIKQAVGVVAAITPWNFPLAMITRKAAPALAAGCAMVLKPAEDTPLCALALAHLAHEAGVPAGILNVVPTNNAKAVGALLSTHPAIKKLSFTGSTEVGKLLMEQCAGTLKKLSLELGGNAPFIVFADADIEAAVEGAITSKFRNAGQTCICANRFYVHTSVAKQFTERFTQAVKHLTVGPGHQEDTDIGPLIHAEAAERVRNLIQKAQDQGAASSGQEQPDNPEGNYVYPVVLTELENTEGFADEELFGPVAPIHTFQSEEQVITLANATKFGLAAYFYGRDYAQIWRVAETLDYGMVGINTGAISTAVAPFGGVKQSGFGREGGKYGIEEYVVTKYLNWQL